MNELAESKNARAKRLADDALKNLGDSYAPRLRSHVDDRSHERQCKIWKTISALPSISSTVKKQALIRVIAESIGERQESDKLATAQIEEFFHGVVGTFVSHETLNDATKEQHAEIERRHAHISKLCKELRACMNNPLTAGLTVKRVIQGRHSFAVDRSITILSLLEKFSETVDSVYEEFGMRVPSHTDDPLRVRLLMIGEVLAHSCKRVTGQERRGSVIALVNAVESATGASITASQLQHHTSRRGSEKAAE